MKVSVQVPCTCGGAEVAVRRRIECNTCWWCVGRGHFQVWVPLREDVKQGYHTCLVIAKKDVKKAIKAFKKKRKGRRAKGS